MRDRVESRRKDAERWLKEKRCLRKEANLGQALLDLADRIEELEQRLMIGETQASQQDHSSELDSQSGEEDSDSDESDGGELSNGAAASSSVSLKRLERHIQKYVYAASLAERIGEEHPFVGNQQPRMSKIESTLLLDLKTALEQTRQIPDKTDTKTSTVLRLYNLMGEDNDAVTAVKNLQI